MANFTTVVIVTFLSLIVWNPVLVAQSIEEFEFEIKNLELVKSELSIKLENVVHKIDSIQGIINQLQYEALTTSGHFIILKPETHLYTRNNARSDVLSVFSDGGKVIFVENAPYNWIKVNHQGIEGFIPGWSIEDESKVVIQVETQRYTARLDSIVSSIENERRWISSTVANIRDQPSTESTVLSQLDRGQLVFIQAKRGDWSSIKYRVAGFRRIDIKNESDIDEMYSNGWVHSNLLSKEPVQPISQAEQAQFLLEQRRIQEEATTRARRSRFVEDTPGLSPVIINQIMNGHVSIGMTKEMVIASWGEPEDINRTITANQVREQWVYGFNNRRYVYFINGIVTTLQD